MRKMFFALLALACLTGGVAAVSIGTAHPALACHG
jgi:Prokaryotic membrane lipoprotein lipid attachment site